MRRPRLAPALLAAAAVVLAYGCAPKPQAPRWTIPGGDARRGAQLASSAGCGTCHQIPGVRTANGQVGPPLTAFARRTVIAGLLPNTPENLVRWIRDPQAVVPGNAMPSTGLSDRDARDLAAYLYTLS